MQARAGAAFATALLVVLAATVTVTVRRPRSAALLGTWEEPHGIGIDEEPYSSPANLWLYWGSTTNRRMTGSGEKIRHIFKMGTIQGAEWRDPKFLRKITGSLFRALSEKCCISLLFPPFEWDFPIYNPSKAIAQRMRSFVANGNAMIFTGGTMDFEFINRYFFYNLEAADGNFSPGPFPLLPQFNGLSSQQTSLLQPAPRVLPQKGIAVTAVKKHSLPSGSTVIYGSPHTSPVFLIKFCMAENPKNGPSVTLPPVKVLPRDCAASARAGRPCSCGNICFLGYNYVEQYPGRWDDALKVMVDVCSQTPPENADPHNYFPPGDGQEAQAEEKRVEDSWQEYQLGAEDPAAEKAAHAAWADVVEARHMAGGLGGSRGGVLVDNPNGASGPVRGTQMGAAQTQFHSAVPPGQVKAVLPAGGPESEKEKGLAAVELEMRTIAQQLHSLAASGSALYARRVAAHMRRLRHRARHTAPEEAGHQGAGAARGLARAGAGRGVGEGKHASGSDTRGARGRCGPLCQLRHFVQRDYAIAAPASV